MMRFSFKKGLSFVRNERIFTIVRRLMDGTLQLEAEDGELINYSEAEILQACAQGSWVVAVDSLNPAIIVQTKISRDLSTFSSKVQERARMRQQYLDRLMEDGKLVCNLPILVEQIRAIAIELADANPPSPITLYRWYKRQQKAGKSITALTDRYENRGRKIAWSNEVRDVVDNAIETIYLNPQIYPKLAVVDEIERNLLLLQKQYPEKGTELRIPAKSSIYRYLGKQEAYEVVASRLGRAVAEKKYRRTLGKQKAKHLLERWEIDHTPINLLVVCERTLLPLGKPWLTLALDKYSRMPVGYYISFRQPAAHAVLQCLKQAIQPKDDLIKVYPDITFPWPARGIPETIVCDNGMDLHANSIIKFCQELGIQVQFCPAKKPEYKGSVERFFRTINHGLIHRIPGTVFSGVLERGEYPSEKEACITLEVLLHLMTKWIVEIYSQTFHRGIDMTPLQKWNLGASERIIEYPVEPAQLDVITGEPENRRVFHYGIEVNGLYYNNHELQQLRRRYGETLRIDLKYYEENMGYVYVFDPLEKNYFKVDAIDQEYAANLRLVQHKAIRKVILDQNRDPANRELLLQKKYELQQIITEAMNSHKMAKRKLGAVYKGKDNLLKQQNDLYIENVEYSEHDAKLSDDLPIFETRLRKDLSNQTGEE